MRPIVASILAVALFTTTLLVALDLALVLGPTSSSGEPRDVLRAASDHVALVDAFYAGANEAVAGEGVGSLQAVVSPRVQVHAGAATPAIGHDAIADHFTAMRRQGDVRLEIVQLADTEDGVAALVEARESSVAGAQAAPLWQTLDRVRIAGGMIAEYWPGAIASRPLPPLPAISLPHGPEGAVVALARLDLGPRAELRALDIPAPRIMLIEHGSVLLPRPEAIAIARANDGEFSAPLAPPRPEELLLGPGDAVLVPANSGQAVQNPGDAPASILSFLVAPRGDLFGPKHNLSHDMLVAVGMHDPGRLARQTRWADGITSETLAVSAPGVASPGAAALNLEGRLLTLEPGGQTALSPGFRQLVAIVSSGILHVAPASATIGTPPAGAPAGDRLLRAGDAVAIAPGARVVLANAGAVRLDLSLIEVWSERGS